MSPQDPASSQAPRVPPARCKAPGTPQHPRQLLAPLRYSQELTQAQTTTPNAKETVSTRQVDPQSSAWGGGLQPGLGSPAAQIWHRWHQ